MRTTTPHLLTSFAVLALAACTRGDGQDPSGPTGGLQISTAPLSYPGLGNVCVGLEV